ncbi:MAG TPA: single-stranded DNA-binding protein [Candidatus Thioglobus sp.]|jgi:hypothetical protein|nr:single-stranded DNA-binding protein [Candidatus Thioglobus sp.]
MASFKEMKKNRMANLESLSKQVEKLAEKPSYEDERIWKLERDKSGNGYAVIRFLPAAQNEDVPWVRIWTHGFKGPGGWYIENSLTTLGKDDPVSKANTALWNSGIDSDKNIARERRRKLNYYSNIYIVEDSLNPQNEGKVFLFRYGKKIFEKITGVMNPEFADETPLNPFDFWEGANFKMKMRQIDGFPNYDKSEFTDIAPLSEDEKKMEEVWSQQYSLNEVIEEKNFKNYAELEARFNTVIARKGDEFVGNIEESTSEPVASTEKTDDTLDYFKKLAEQE